MDSVSNFWATRSLSFVAGAHTHTVCVYIWVGQFGVWQPWVSVLTPSLVNPLPETGPWGWQPWTNWVFWFDRKCRHTCSWGVCWGVKCGFSVSCLQWAACFRFGIALRQRQVMRATSHLKAVTGANETQCHLRKERNGEVTHAGLFTLRLHYFISVVHKCIITTTKGFWKVYCY